MRVQDYDDLTRRVIGAAIAVHRALGPGLLESAYEFCLAAKFGHEGLRFQRQRPLPLVYRGETVDCGYRLDFAVEEQVIVEVKAVESLNRVHEAQVLSYLKLSGLRVGLLINFHEYSLKKGLRRFVNNH
jgi:GxxExxY protein